MDPYIDEADALHIFRVAPGHVQDTPEHRRLLLDMVRPENALGHDRFGNSWYAGLLDDGRQVWVQARGSRIRNGGINATPRTFHPLTGLSGRER